MTQARRWFFALSVVALLALAWTQRELLSDVDEPRHAVVTQDGPFEIRDYQSVVAAETLVRSLGRREATNSAFASLFGYISGENTAQVTIAMTVPVATGADGERIAMTAPVTQVQDSGGWRVRFFLPPSYTLNTAPVPTNPAVELVEVPARRVVAIRFSGWASPGALDDQLQRLQTYVVDNGLTPIGDPVLAQYNSPFVLPFLRRNEFLWRLESDGEVSATANVAAPAPGSWVDTTRR